MKSQRGPAYLAGLEMDSSLQLTMKDAPTTFPFVSALLTSTSRQIICETPFKSDTSIGCTLVQVSEAASSAEGKRHTTKGNGCLRKQQ
jgi:hypothetical protein